MLTGMGSLGGGDLAGARMQPRPMLNDPEEEHDCFSGVTHHSHFHDGVGIRNVCFGRHTRPDGTVVAGPALSDLVAAADRGLDARLRGRPDASVAALDAIRAAVAGGPRR